MNPSSVAEEIQLFSKRSGKDKNFLATYIRIEAVVKKRRHLDGTARVSRISKIMTM